MKRLLKQILTLSLTAILFLNLILPITATWDNISISNPYWEDAINDGSYYEYFDSIFDDDDIVRASIVLYEPSVVEKYGSEDIVNNDEAMAYKNELEQIQNGIANKISSTILNGDKLDVIWNLTIVLNAFSVNIPYGKVLDIYNMPEVRYVILENTYSPVNVIDSETAEPQMTYASTMVGGNTAWDYGYTGAGTKIAIIDTGIDINHISFDSEAYEYAISLLEEQGNNYDLFTIEDLDAVLANLHIYSNYENLTSDKLYISSKIPFAFNYMDNSLDVSHLNDNQTDHGSHVAGISAANRFIKTETGYAPALETVYTQGVAPDAQLVVMKVFGQSGSPSDSDFLVAVEDAMLLGCEAINLSLGDDSVGYDFPDDCEYVLENLIYTDSVVLCAAGNASTFAKYTYQGLTYADDVSLARVASPSTCTNSVSVASFDNAGMLTNAFNFEGSLIPFFDPDPNGIDIKTFYGTYDFVYVDSTGTEEDFAKVKDLIQGKIVICNRGDISFSAKADAAFANGAAGIFIANNLSGFITMNLGKYYSEPVYSISLEDALLIKEKSEKHDFDETLSYYTGTLTIDAYKTTVQSTSNYYILSNFSSWGIPGSLTIKPEISAPGGNIYSVNGLSDGKSYKFMSGTSMATPNVTGLTALLSQYIRENNLKEKTGLSQRVLLTSLLMSTAEPVLDGSNEFYYSVLAQGAGLARVDKAMDSSTYILMDPGSNKGALDGKVKAELGEQDNNFQVGFNVYNMADKPVTITLNATFFTQDIIEGPVPNMAGTNYVYDDEGNLYITSYISPLTKEIASTSEWSIQTSINDFNNDGYWNIYDALDLLEYVTGASNPLRIIEEKWNFSIADVDNDGDVDTYDAYLLMNCDSFTIDAGSSVHIQGDFEISMDEYLYKDNGNYIEGYIFVNEVKNEEDGINGISHSIPVLGYYGKWSDPSMFDRGSFIEFAYGLEEKTPYYASSIKEEAKNINAFIINESTKIGQNPVTLIDIDEDGNPIYRPERYAVKASDVLKQFSYVQIRNSGGSRFLITNSNGEILYERIDSRYDHGIHYNINTGKWNDTVKKEIVNYSFSGIPEGEILTLSYSLATPYDVKEDGTIDWDNLGKGATKQVSVIVDNTLPEIISVTSGYDEETNKTGITLTAVDNQYIAGAILYNIDGEILGVLSPSSANQSGEIYKNTFEIDLEAKDDSGAYINRYFAIEVQDYAGNKTTYRLNLNEEEIENSDLEISANDITFIYTGKLENRQIDYTVLPWSIENTTDYSITFESSDPNVATVDEKGVITPLVTTDATCEIYITINAFEKTIKESIDFTIKALTNNFSGIIKHNNSYYIADIDLYDLTIYATPYDSYTQHLAHVINTPNGKFASDYNGWNKPINIYKIEDDYSLTPHSTCKYSMSSFCSVPSLGSSYIMGTYGKYVILIDIDSGKTISSLDLSFATNGALLTSITYLNHNDITGGDNIPSDNLIVCDELGHLYLITVYMDNEELMAGKYVYNFYNMTNYQNKVPLNSLYFDGQNIILSSYESDKISRISVLADIYGSQQEIYLGAFNNEETNLNGIFQENVVPCSEFNTYSDFLDQFENVNIIEFPDKEPTSAIVIEEEIPQPEQQENNTLFNMNTMLSMSSTKQSSSPSGINSQTKELENQSNYNAISFTADEDTHNGLMTIKLNKEELGLILFLSNTTYHSFSIDVDAGTVTYGFISREPIEKDEIVLNILFRLNEEAKHTNFYISNKQLNNTHFEEVEHILIGEHLYSSPEWTWNEDLTKATAKFVCEYDETHILELEGEIEVIAHVDPTCETSGYTTYKASVQLGDVTYSDTQTEIIDPIGHDWDTPTYVWSANHTYVTAKVVCKHNSDHVIKETIKTTELVLRNPTCTLEGYVRYKAYFTNELFVSQVRDVILDKASHVPGPIVKENVINPTCTDNGSYDEVRYCRNCGCEISRDTITIPAFDHTYTEHYWTWSEDGKATITFTCANDPSHILVVDVKDINVDVKSATALEDGLTTYTAKYIFIDGKTYTDTKTVVIPKLGPNRKLIGVSIDDVLLGDNDYTFVVTQDGETIVKVNESYLSKLPNGSHTLTIKYEDGDDTTNINTNYQIEESTTETSFESTTNPSETTTTNNTTLIIVIVVCVLVLGVVIVLVIVISKKKKK